ncbi:MAG: hypothetical protein IPK22_26175 [Verrucomicrobiaceae bacterium]|nr:hypothetical protein [Verrucomicrobiaceae bacterium]
MSHHEALSTNDELRIAAFVQKGRASVADQISPPRMGVEEVKGARAVFDEAVTELATAGFPVGWNQTATAWAQHPISTLFESSPGWLMAGAAAAPGAQFWGSIS